VLRHEIEGAADAGEHAERQHVDLEDAERVEVVLVPFDVVRSSIAAFMIGTISSSGRG
jgi:hypothetical protein